MYRRRVALEWRTAVGVAIAAALGLLLARLPVDDIWSTGVFGAIVLTGLVAVVAAFRYPVEPPAMPRRFGYDDVTAASKRVHRGQPVDPPELQAAAIARARQGCRIIPLSIGWFPVTGATWTIRGGEPGLFGGLGYVGPGLMLLGTAGLVWSGLTQHRLDRLDRLEDASAGDAPPVTTT